MEIITYIHRVEINSRILSAPSLFLIFSTFSSILSYAVFILSTSLQRKVQDTRGQTSDLNMLGKM